MRCHLILALGSLLTTAGCIGPAADVAANGLVLGGPSDPAFSMLADSLEAGVVLARPVSLTDLESNLVDAESVALDLDGASVPLAPEATGLYLYDPAAPTAAYTAGATVTLRATVDGEESSATLVAPPAPDLQNLVPDVHVAGTAIRVNLTAYDFALAYGAVIDAQGNILWDDRPTTTEEIIADLRDAGSVNEYVFPAAAFPTAGTGYGVALVGIEAAQGNDFSNFERFWSNFGVGAIGTKTLVTAN